MKLDDNDGKFWVDPKEIEHVVVQYFAIIMSKLYNNKKFGLNTPSPHDLDNVQNFAFFLSAVFPYVC